MTRSGRLLAALLGALLACGSAAAGWERWDELKAVSLDGARVVDYSDERQITTSEGQSYALFFALVADDREAFDRILGWTADNLAGGDLSRGLPVWLWGKNESGWGTIDGNDASDSDLWIAYCLLEAGRLWDRPDYTEKGRAMLPLIADLARDLRHYGRVLLPARTGFETRERIKLNPSYYPIFILRRLALEDPLWDEVCAGSLRVLLRSAPRGFSPDWASLDREGRIVAMNEPDNAVGSYNAIRAYLWAGLTSPRDPAYAMLAQAFAPMVSATIRLGSPPEKVDLNTLAMNRPGNAGFAACLLELTARDAAGAEAAASIRARLSNTRLAPDSYYSNMLILFAQGFDEGRFRFDERGRLCRPGLDRP